MIPLGVIGQLLNTNNFSVVIGSLRIPDLLTQDFELGSIPGGWTLDNGTPNYGYTPALRGNFSLFLSASTGDQTFATFSSAVNQAYSVFQYKCTSLPAGTHTILRLRSGSAATQTLGYVSITSTGQMQVLDWNQTTQSITVGTLSINTTYYVWTSYTTGSGNNSVHTVGFSTTPVEPTSGNNYATLNAGTSTSSISQFDYFNSANGPTGSIYDHIGVATFDMPDGW